MIRHLRFSEIPHRKFPLTDAKYGQLRANIYAAALGFSSLDTSAGQSVCRELCQAQHHLERAWNMIQQTKESEQRRDREW
jgi:hypothetical protein